MLSAKLGAYGKEFAFACSSARDWRSRASLLWSTALFHGMNAFGGTTKSDRSFSVRLEIGHGYVATLRLRPFAGDIFVLYEVFLDGCYHIPENLVPLNDVRTIVDCGANVGITSLYFASRYPNATIFSIEPHPDNYLILQENTRSEPRIVPINAAVVGAPVSSVRMTVSEPAWGNKLSPDESGIIVPALTISQLIEQHGLRQIDLLKVDIEGAEKDVFAHAEFLLRVKFGIIELHGSYSTKRFDDDLAKWRFATKAPLPEDGLKMLTFRSA